MELDADTPFEMLLYVLVSVIGLENSFIPVRDSSVIYTESIMFVVAKSVFWYEIGAVILSAPVLVDEPPDDIVLRLLGLITLDEVK